MKAKSARTAPHHNLGGRGETSTASVSRRQFGRGRRHGLVGAAPASAANTIVVRPGQSIQAAVFRAHPGDTVLIKPGTYRESVYVAVDRLTIRGSGAAGNGTVLEPGRPSRSNPCSQQGGNGFCVIGTGSNPTSGVRITALLVQNYGGNGIIGFHSDGLVVDDVTAKNNGSYGIARFASSGGALIKNKASGSGEAGLYIGDSPHANVVVEGNDVRNNCIGIFQRHARDTFMAYNTANGNAVGVLVLDDGQAGGAGNAYLKYNTVANNNTVCAANPEHPTFQGGGIVLLGATHSFLAQNSVLGNRGSTAISGGIVLLTAKNFTGGANATDNTIRNNTAFRNSPADIVDQSGGRNDIGRNFCHTSMPRGYCHN